MQYFFKFRIRLEDERFLIYKDVAISPTSSLKCFLETALDFYKFDTNKEKEVFTCNSSWYRDEELDSNSSTVLNDLINAPEFYMYFRYDPKKLWTFYISLIGIEQTKEKLPFVIQEKGLGPSQYAASELRTMGKELENDLARKIRIKSSVR